MIKVVFVCHGNICRSPMAEFMFKDLVKKKGVEKQFRISSRATSSEEIGHHIHYGTREILEKNNIPYNKSKVATKISKEEYNDYDFILIMDRNNLYNIKCIFRDDLNKVHLLLEYAGENRDIRDPWYTGNFYETYQDLSLGLNCFYDYLVKNNLVR